MRAEVYDEQKAAIEALQRRGLSTADVARLLVATTNSVAAWRDGEKAVAGRVRRLLLELSAMPEQELEEMLTGINSYPRGRLNTAEEAKRYEVMEAAGLWPPRVCARAIRDLSDRARDKGITSTDLIEFLGVSRRTFYHYRSDTNSRPLPVEVVRRLQLLEKYLAGGERGDAAGLCLLTLEGRFERASIVLFDKFHYVGFSNGDPLKEHALLVLANETHFDARTIRRYLPVRDRERRVSRAVVAAFEEAARRLGAIV